MEDFLTCNNENCKLKDGCARYQFKDKTAQPLGFMEPTLCEYYCPENARSNEAFMNSLGLLCHDFNISIQAESFGRKKFNFEDFNKLRDAIIK